jgi:Uma2 family endonuclease
MSIATLPVTQLFPPGRLLTVEDVAELPRELPSGDVSYELDEGRLVVMAPPGDMHGSIQARLATELNLQGERRKLGKARAEVGVILWRGPDTLRGPDVAFITNASLPIRLSKHGYLVTMPELVGEILSRNDKPYKVRRKVKQYLKAGVRAVWVVDPEKRNVTEYRCDRKPRVFQNGDTLTIEDIIPGFKLRVAALLET